MDKEAVILKLFLLGASENLGTTGWFGFDWYTFPNSYTQVGVSDTEIKYQNIIHPINNSDEVFRNLINRMDRLDKLNGKS